VADFNRWLLPAGVEDRTALQALNLFKMQQNLVNVFQSQGYTLVDTPWIEFLDTLSLGAKSDLKDQIYTFTDTDSGRQLGLRADITPQIARLDAQAGVQGVAKWCYYGSVLRSQLHPIRPAREFIQAGAECFGDISVLADLEILRLALDSLKSLGLKNLVLDLGHVGFLQTLFQLAQLDAQEMDFVLSIFERQSGPDLAQWLADCSSKNTHDVLVHFSTLFDARGDITEWATCQKKLASVVGWQEIIARLDVLLQGIGLSHPDVCLHFDLSEPRSYQYHTGMSFSIWQKGLTWPLCQGGRYDPVISSHGLLKRPAVGFSLDILAILPALPSSKPRPRAYWFLQSGFDPFVYPDLIQAIGALRDQGWSVEQKLNLDHSLNNSKILAQNTNGLWFLVVDQAD
jgi:ATP phosphoribosyltransferase regulatory subunit